MEDMAQENQELKDKVVKLEGDMEQIISINNDLKMKLKENDRKLVKLLGYHDKPIGEKIISSLKNNQTLQLDFHIQQATSLSHMPIQGRMQKDLKLVKLHQFPLHLFLKRGFKTRMIINKVLKISVGT